MKCIHKLLHIVKKSATHIYVRGISLLCPINSKKVFFSSFLGKSYSDNPRAISEELHELFPSADIVWAFIDPVAKASIVPTYVRVVKTGSIKAVFEQTTSKIWVDNYCKNVDTIKRKNQYYIQTWHGDRAIKKVLYDADPEANLSLFESDNIDLAVAGSVFGERMYRTAFKYHGEVLTKGCPRNDILVRGNPECVDEFRNHYNIPQNAKILLFAPTFRDSNAGLIQHVSDLDLGRILNALKKKSGQEWVLLVRGHTGRKLQFDKTYSEKVFDVSDYEDSKYVLLAADAIISDYSTMSTDFILTGKPTFLFINDYHKYSSKDRSIWFDLKNTPFWSAETQNELEMIIDKKNIHDATDNCNALLNMYESRESGHASELVCKWIIERLN